MSIALNYVIYSLTQSLGRNSFDTASNVLNLGSHDGSHDVKR